MKVKFFLGIVLLPIFASAQIRATVKDSLTGKPIAYVAILSGNKMYGGSSDSDGIFEVPSSDAASGLEFSVVGYTPKSVKKFSKGQEILMQRKPSDNRIKATLKKTELRQSGKIPENYDPTQTSSFFNKPTILAKFFPKLSRFDDTPYLSAVIVNVLSKKEDAVYKVRVFEVDGNGFPGKDAVDEDIIVRTKSGDHNAKIDLSQYGIRMGENGLFVGVETILVDENLSNVKWKTDSNDPDSAIHKNVYQPTFRGNAIGKGSLWRFYNGKWTLVDEKEKRKTTKGKYFPMNNLYLEIELSN